MEDTLDLMIALAVMVEVEIDIVTKDLEIKEETNVIGEMTIEITKIGAISRDLIGMKGIDIEADQKVRKDNLEMFKSIPKEVKLSLNSNPNRAVGFQMLQVCQ